MQTPTYLVGEITPCDLIFKEQKNFDSIFDFDISGGDGICPPPLAIARSSGPRRPRFICLWQRSARLQIPSVKAAYVNKLKANGYPSYLVNLEAMGFEPTTFRMQTGHSPNWATPP